jgi:CDP-diglyceride synthetase
MIPAILGILFVVIGVKGFTEAGIPLSKNKTLEGTAGKIVGTICIVLGVAYCASAFGLFPWQHP